MEAKASLTWWLLAVGLWLLLWLLAIDSLALRCLAVAIGYWLLAIAIAIAFAFGFCLLATDRES